MDMRTALFSGEDRAVNFARCRSILGDNTGAARSAQGFVRGKGNDVSKPDRAGNCLPGDQTGNMGDIRQQDGANRIGNLAEPFPVRNPWVGGVAGNDDLGHGSFCLFRQGIIIDLLGDGIHVVMNNVIQFA